MCVMIYGVVCIIAYVLVQILTYTNLLYIMFFDYDIPIMSYILWCSYNDIYHDITVNSYVMTGVITYVMIELMRNIYRDKCIYGIYIHCGTRMYVL